MANEIKSIVVQGTTVDARLIAAYKKSFAKHETILSVWANAATVQMAKHGNRNWLDTLFQLPVMTIKSGDLSKQGYELYHYIKAHFPRLVWDKKTCKMGLVKLQKDSILSTHFVAVGATSESETVKQSGAKFYSEFGDFALTFTEFKNLEKPEVEKEEVAPKMTATAFSNQADKALDCFKAGRFIGTEEEILSAMVKAKALFLALDAQLVKQEAEKQKKLAEAGIAATAGDKVDSGKAEQSASVGTNRNGNNKGADKRAGGKVAPLAATA
jgi:hypothetical protein